MPTDAPQPLLTRSVEVDGARVRYDVRGDGPRDVLLVHGFRAHHLWWHRVVPALVGDFRVIEVDLSGHGDSDHRASYDAALWAAELLAVLEDAGSAGAVIAGHSMGGRVAVSAAARTANVSGLVLFDTKFWPPTATRRLRELNSEAPKVHPARDAIMSRFRMSPPQPDLPAGVRRVLADYAVRETEGGWTWKYDHRGLSPLAGDDILADLARLTVPVRFAYGTRSRLVDGEVADLVRRSTTSAVEVERIQGGHHHVILDSPAACARVILDGERAR